MVVRFTKARHADRPPTFTCVRDNGTTTGMASTAFFVRHDLTHYAVETCLGMKQAFYGLIAAGWEIGSFEDREPGSRKSREVPPEAILAEVIVGTFDLEVTAGELPPAEFLKIVGDKLGSGEELPAPAEIAEIRLRRDELLARWIALVPGETMELTW